MPIRFFCALLFLLTILSYSCQPDDSLPTFDSEFGAIFVTVEHNGRLIDKAVVSTSPASTFFETDASGSVIIRDLTPGIYQVYASHPDIGTGTAAVTISGGLVSDLTLQLIEGFFVSPSVSFSFPTEGAQVDLTGETIFSVVVDDAQDDPETLSLEWKSDVDGILSTVGANSAGNANATISGLTEGMHIISVTATDSDGNIGGASVQIEVTELPNAVLLSPLEGSQVGINLNWTESEEANFVKYTIYRSTEVNSNFQDIAEFTNKDQTTFLDQNVSIDTDYYYRIGVTLSNGQEGLSNIQFIAFAGATIDVGTQLERMKADPDRPFIYALDRLNNSLLFIDREQLEVTKTIFVGSSPTDLDISMDGTKLYVANFGSSQITVVDLETQELDFNLFVDTEAGSWDGNPYRLVALANNRLAYTSEDQWNSVKLINASTGVFIDDTGSVYQPGLLRNPNGTAIYVTEAGSSGSQAIRYNINGNSLSEVDASSSSTNPSSNRDGLITANGVHIFYNRRKLLAGNLQSSLGTFSSAIYAITSDGSFAIGEEQYFSGNTFAILGFLPVSTRTMVAHPTEDLIYLFDSQNSRIILFSPI